MCIIVWFRDIIREGTFQGFHTRAVTRGLRIGVILFIVSEACLFVCFFWAFFHGRITPCPFRAGGLWPFYIRRGAAPFHVPIINTILLVFSGFTLTWAHIGIEHGLCAVPKYIFFLSVLLGAIFTLVQAIEYSELFFAIADGINGSSFYLGTGFHGGHVIIGASCLRVMFIRFMSRHFSREQITGVDTGGWYWHFVDVVWLILFMCFYWWGFGEGGSLKVILCHTSLRSFF